MSNYRRRLMLANQLEEKLYLYGNSVQDGTPAPEVPIDIMSVENPTIKVVTGNNLLQPKPVGSYEFVDTTDTFEILEDGGVYFESVTNNDSPVINASPFNTITIQKDGVYTFSQKGGGSIISSVVDVSRNGQHTYYYYRHYNITMTLQVGDVVSVYIQISKDTAIIGVTVTDVLMYCHLNEGSVALPYEPYKEELITIDETTPFGKNVLPYPYYDSDKEIDTKLTFNSTEKDNGQVLINGKSDTTDIYYCTEPDSNNEGLLNNIFQDKETYSISDAPIGYTITEMERGGNFTECPRESYELISTDDDGARHYIYTSSDNIKYKLGPIGGTGAHRTHDGGYNAELICNSGYGAQKRFIPTNNKINSLSLLIACPRILHGIINNVNYPATVQRVHISYLDGTHDIRDIIITTSQMTISLRDNGGNDSDRLSRFMVYVPKKDANGVELDLSSRTVLENNCKILTKGTNIGLDRELTFDDIDWDWDIEGGVSTQLAHMVYGSNHEALRSYGVNSNGYVNSITLNFDKEVEYIDLEIDSRYHGNNGFYYEVNIPGASDRYAYYARFSNIGYCDIALLGATYTVNGEYTYIDLDYNRDIFATLDEILEYGVFENKINNEYQFPSKDLNGNILDTTNPWFGRKGLSTAIKRPDDIIKRPYIFLIDSILPDGKESAYAYSFPPISYALRYIDKSTGNEFFYRNTRFTVDKSKYLYCDFRIEVAPNYKITNTLASPMIQRGFSVDAFEKYKAPITTMRGIGNYKDCIYIENDRVWFENNIFHIKPTDFSRINNNRAVIDNLPHPNDYLKYSEKISNFGNYKSAWDFQDYIIWYLAKTDSEVSQIWMVPSKEYSDLWTTKEEAWTHLTETLAIYPEFQYVLATPITTEITGYLAEKILAIDKNKNILIYSDNGVYGDCKII